MAAPKKWLITGGCGFIGTTLIALLRKQDPATPIRVVDNLSTGLRDDLAVVTEYTETAPEALAPMVASDKAELVIGDILDEGLAVRAAQGADVIVHLAANTGVQPSIQNPMADMRANVTGTVNYLEAARINKVGSFVFASSGAPIGKATPPIREDAVCRPISPYGASKLSGEAYCSAYNGSFGVNTVVLRFSNVYGPLSGHKGSVVAKFLTRSVNGRPWTINGDGKQTRDFIFSRDLVRALVMAVEQEKGGELFQVASGTELSILDLTKVLAPLVKKYTGKTPELEYGPPLTGDVMRNFADISHAKKELGWKPEMELTKGLEETVKWFFDK